jgi:hypothetical protein
MACPSRVCLGLDLGRARKYVCLGAFDLNIVVLTSFIVMSFYVALYSVAIFATDGLGLSQAYGVIVQSLLAAGLMVGRPLA